MRHHYGTSDCCDATIYNEYTYAGEAICGECGEHCNNTEEDTQTNYDVQTEHWDDDRRL